MSPRRLLSLVAVLVAIAVVPPSAAAAHAPAAHGPAEALRQADVIRGRVIGPDSVPVEGVIVTATSIAGNVNRTARTDKSGRYTIIFPGGEGDYMVSFAAVGFALRRFEVKRTADQEILVADAKLQRVGAVLDAVKVAAEREKPRRTDAAVPDLGRGERAVQQAAVPVDMLGDLAAMAASLPGVQLVPGQDGDPNGYSVLGLGADQNNTTLNGMSFGGSNLPRDAAVSSSLVTAPYDVSRGGFSGGQFSLRSQPGSNFIGRRMSLNLDAPQMQWTDAAARALGRQYSSASLSGSVSGPVVFDKAFYNVSYQLGRRSSDLQSLLNTDPEGLQAAGVAADSVDRLLALLRQAQVPTTTGRLPGSNLSDQGSLFGSFDFAPPASTSGQAINVAVNGSWNKQNPVFPLTTALPTNSGDRTNWNGGLQARHNNYYGFGIFSETSVGLNQSRNHSEPYLALPGGRVRVNSSFADGTSGLQTLTFGGNQGLNSSQTTTNLTFLNQLSWFSASNKHRLKFTSELRHEGNTVEQTNNLLGSFNYNSLVDLEANRPSSFSRQLAPREREAGQLVGALSLGDSYRHSQNLQIQYGVRLDANRFTADPSFNPAVDSAFGVRNDRVPNNFFLSPRVGFSWAYGKAPQVSAFEGAMRAPRAVVRGGIGMFQNTLGTTIIGQALDNTALASAVQQLSCIGPATPIPDWDAYAANPELIPTRCADGSTGSVFANSAPNVTLFARDYSAPRSLRGNLQWTGPILSNRFSATIDGTYSRNQQQAGFVDLNFRPDLQFTLADENGRPVYVQPTSIVPATGAIASRDARVSDDFARVTELRSDLASESRQLRLSLSPTRFSTGFSWTASYVWSDVRERVRGFSSTAGNPLDVEWARAGFTPRHQVTYNLGYNFFDFVRVNWFGQVASGTRFTPTIAGDVNGDGYANDRAFIFDPNDPQRALADPALAEGMRALLDNGSDAARACLRAQRGALAGRNSCQSPWTTTANMSFSFNPLKVRMPQRATLSFAVSNPLGAADLLLDGERGLRGWGQQTLPDQSLLYVRGFDPATRRYRYEVNQRFGETSPAYSAFRTPVTLTAMLRFDVGPTRERQSLTQQLDRGRRRPGDLVPEPLVKAIASSGIQNPMATILRQQDTLGLTTVQADSIAAMNRRYTVSFDSIWTPLARELAAMPKNYDHDDAYDRYRHARQASVDMLIKIAPTLKRLLTDEQRRRLPAFVSMYLEPRYLASIRSGTAGAGGGGPMMMGGGGMMIGGGGGGGATRIEIVR